MTDGSFAIKGLLSLSWARHLGLLEAKNWSSWGSLQMKRHYNIWPKTGHPCFGKQGSVFSSEPHLFPSLKSLFTILYLGCSFGMWTQIFLKHLYIEGFVVMNNQDPINGLKSVPFSPDADQVVSGMNSSMLHPTATASIVLYYLEAIVGYNLVNVGPAVENIKTLLQHPVDLSSSAFALHDLLL